ncbi:MAG: hypothetical protein ACRD2J_07695 [Thermoanaerobaculia bacterium]
MNSAPVVWIVSAEQWTRALLRGELIERGYDAVGFLDAGDALDHLPSRPPDAIIVELRGLPRRQLEQLVRIGVPLIATGGATDLADETLQALDLAAVLPRPVSLGTIADRVAALVPPGKIES